METTTTPANLKGMAKYNRVLSAIAEDTTAAMLHAFATLTDGAKAIVLQSGKFSNLYIRGEHKEMAAEEAAKELTDRAAAGVTRKLRKIDHICAVAFLAEYISRQRKADKPTETPNPELNNTPTAMNTNEIVASLNEKQVRTAAAKLLPAKFFDEYFTPERGNIALLRQILEDYVFEYDTTATEIIEAAGADETANETKAPEFSDLTHAGQCLDIYLHNTREIYDRYTVPAIERVTRAIKAGEYVSDNAGQLAKDIQEITPALQAAARLVKKYDHLTHTAKDIEQVTRNYAAYIVDCAKYELETAVK